MTIPRRCLDCPSPVHFGPRCGRCRQAHQQASWQVKAQRRRDAARADLSASVIESIIVSEMAKKRPCKSA